MRVLINKSYTLWFPIYVLNDPKYQESYLGFMHIIVFILSLVCICFTIYVAYIIIKIRVYHINYTVLTFYFICLYFEAIFAKYSIILYQIGVLKIPGIDEKYTGWWSEGIENIAQINSANDAITMIIGSFLIWHYLYSVITLVFFISLERTIATYVIRSYETNRRVYVSIFLIFMSNCLSLFLATTAFTDFFTFPPLMIFNGLINIFSLMLFGIITHINNSINRKMNKETVSTFYSLPYRFQMKENIRTLKLSKRVIVSVGCYILIFCIVLFVLYCETLPSLNMLLIFTLESGIYLNPLIICPIMIFSVKPYSKVFRRHLKNISILQYCCNINERVEQLKTTAPQETEIYFINLKNSWN
ncbi:unnamed protein product [Caenorhabditis angaria]|uniref:Uncharacterized protein n=1 Tax=Caenorhabditis angaria TaxID=860376 RepID=A0A9P1ICB3_9PELO|nr:unnamed protein product [Caenorhabditis angaria]